MNNTKGTKVPLDN